MQKKIWRDYKHKYGKTESYEETILLANRAVYSQKVLIVCPSSYYVGMSNLAVHSVYRTFHQEGFFCDRMFYGPRKNERMQRSVELRLPPGSFDIIAFTVSYELDLYNIRDFLKEFNLGDKHRPYIISGGPMASLNPELVQSFSDAVYIGEFEKNADQICSWLRNQDEEKPHILKIQGKCYGMLDSLNFSNGYSAFLTKNTVFSNTFLIEPTRGCSSSCNFCFLSSHAGKFRIMPRERFFHIVEQVKAERMGIVSAALSDIPYLDEMLAYFKIAKIHATFSSLKIKNLKDSLLHYIVETGQNSVTIAPESGSGKILEKINKNITVDDIFKGVEKIQRAGIRSVKLYMMYGFSAEEDTDIEETVHLGQSLCRQFPQISFSAVFNPFIPKPCTVFENEKILPVQLLKERQKKLEKGWGSEHGFSSVSFESIKTAYLQYQILYHCNSLSELPA